MCGTRGDPVVAADAGEVIDVGVTRGYGNYVLIRHDEDTVTRYAHCDTITVEVGDSVAQGSQIATLGSTGNATGVHVHFEIIINGSTVDPLPYMSGPQLEILYNY
ncbi:MAG: M23 family metallopeptidase [Clostridia bacterium]|nr:M23 family metallopeptidase [Clostridia bacterium]